MLGGTVMVAGGIVVGCVMCASVLLSLCRGLDICGGISRGGGCTILISL